MTPADQMSSATVWAAHLNRTSGARKPRVPARFALLLGRGSSRGKEGIVVVDVVEVVVPLVLD